MDFDYVINRLKKKLDIKYDSDMAYKLGMKPPAFAERKRRNSVPVDKITELCKENNIDPNTILQSNESVRLINYELKKVVQKESNDIYDFDTESIRMVVFDAGLMPREYKNEDMFFIRCDVMDRYHGLKCGDVIAVDTNFDKESYGDYVVMIGGQVHIKTLTFKLDGVIEIKSVGDVSYVDRYDPNTSKIHFKIIGKKAFVIAQ